MSQPIIDLTNCEKEPIHIPGKIQSHGFLLAVDTQSGLINYVSENISKYVQVEAKTVLGKGLDYLSEALALDVSVAGVLSQLINTGFNLKSIESLNPFVVELQGQAFNIIFFASANDLIIEFEINTNDGFESQKVIGSSISKILKGITLDSLLQNTAIEIKKVINYDRVMVYRFDDDDHGQVIAEEKEEHLEPFLHLHYPASDIPKQARELYKINLTRIISDVNAEPSPILTYETESTPIDLTNAELRAVSPMHIQYLKNMGVCSSFSISLVVKGELWGLIACHNYSAKFINYAARSASKLIGQILSSAIEYRQSEENNERFDLLDKASQVLVEMIDNSNEIPEALTKKEITIKDITEASGAVLIFEQKLICIGETPGESQIAALAEWLFDNMAETVYTSHRFPRVYKPAEKFSGVAAGVMACILSRELKEIIIWFKPELLENIQWAGNPDKPVEISAEGVMTLTPRKSFKSWTETVRHTSLKWGSAEVAAVIKMREHIIYAIKRKANEIRQLNEKLILAYDELDTFSYTISHDLRTPLSSIKGYAELLASNDSLDTNARKLLQRINKCTDKMASLITDILNYSRIGQTKVNKEIVEMGKVIEDTKMDIVAAFNPIADFSIGATPSIYGDKTMIVQVFANLMGNAVKYSSKTSNPRVVINGEVKKNEVVYSIADNGIGIDINYYNKIFEIFKRMDNVQDIEGTGVGLAIVKKIMDKHNGRIWFESTIGAGTTFFVAFKNKQ